MQRFRRSLLRRIVPHGIAVFIVWPLLSALAATLTIKDQVIAYFVSWPLAFFGHLYAAVRMAPEFIAVGLILYLPALLFFSSISLFRFDESKWVERFVEPWPLLLALFAGIALEYPTVLHHPLLRVIWFLNVQVASVLIAAVAVAVFVIIGYRAGLNRGAAASLVLSISLLVGGYLVAIQPPRREHAEAPSRNAILFGIDSLAHADDLGPLRDYTLARGGLWFERPVTPALMTNPVWCSILLHRPVSETGVYIVRQRPDWKSAPYNVVSRARELGYVTWSFFSDQFTTYVGSDAGFDRDRSGPRGWLQVATSGVKDGSVILPLALQNLPRIPFATTPPNQSGTYSFDVVREVNAILTAGWDTRQPDFVAAHLDYLHQPRFPRYSELSRQKHEAVLAARVASAFDPSLDFNYPALDEDPLELYAWKIRNVQRLVIDEMEATGVAEPEKHNRLILLSDHGSRTNIQSENFGDEKFHRVLFAGFGIEPTDPVAPISLIDASVLVGIDDPTRAGSAEPVVEFAYLGAEKFGQLVRSARLKLDGDTILDSRLVAELRRELKAYAPYDPQPEYISR